MTAVLSHGEIVFETAHSRVVQLENRPAFVAFAYYLQILRSISSQFQNFSSEIFKNSGAVDGSSGSDSMISINSHL